MAEQTLDDIFFNKKIDNLFLVNSIQKHINKLAVEIGPRPVTNEQSIKKITTIKRIVIHSNAPPTIQGCHQKSSFYLVRLNILA